MRKVYLLVLPSLIYLFFWFIYPFIYDIYISFFYYSLQKPMEPVFIGFDNYVKVFSDPAFINSIKITFVYTAICFVIELGLGMGIAFLLARDLPGITVLRILFMIPVLLMPIGIGVMWKLMFLPGFGVADYLAGFFGMAGLPWFGDFFWSSVLIILMDVWQWTPFMTLIILAGILGLPKEPYEAAAVDGLTQRQIFTKITLPMLGPVIAIASLLRILDLFKLYDPIFVVTRGGVGTETLSHYIYRTGFRILNIGWAGCVSFMFWIIVFVLANILVRLLGYTIWGETS